jgi:hypothetical protein
MSIFLKAILYCIELSVAILLTMVAFLFGWVIALFVDTQTGHLPYFLKWFETVDASCYDEQWVAEHPTWSKYKIATTWIMRNPAYGFCAWCAPKHIYGETANTPVVVQGDVNIADGLLGKAGWFFISTPSGWFNFSYVIDLKNGKCIRGEMGWYMLPIAKGYTSVNTGLLQTSPVRFYDFGRKGN